MMEDTWQTAKMPLKYALSFEKADCVITHLVEMMAILGISLQIETDNVPACVPNKMQQFFKCYDIKHCQEPSSKDWRHASGIMEMTHRIAWSVVGEL